MNTCLNCGIETNNKKFCSISCQNKFQNTEKANKKFGLFKDFTVKCDKCGKEFIINAREKLFPQKEKYFCSRGCANSRRHSVEIKDKIKKSLVKTKGTKQKIKICCRRCSNNFEVGYNKRKQTFCSRSCAVSWRNVNQGLGRKAGLSSVNSQSKIRRSKNEICFAELCKNKFKKVLTNEPLFNGWDADVIIEDYKIAVLWNGNWHYKKIKQNHSVGQVQNRDRIKIKEIQAKGYVPYVIEDRGKYNKEFVKKQFDELLAFLKLSS